MALLLAIALSFGLAFLQAVIVYLLDRYEQEPFKLIMGAFFWGAVGAVIVAFIINTIFGVGAYMVTSSEETAKIYSAVLSAPIVEEIAKGLAVLVVYAFFRNEFDSTLDGIVYAAITAIGFAATENVLYIYRNGYLQGGWEGFQMLAVTRLVVVAWQHPFYTAFTGIGLAYSRNSRNGFRKYFAPILGLFVAMSAHGFHNLVASMGSEVFCTVGLLADWSGWIAMVIFIFMVAGRERKWMAQYLMEEVRYGIMTVDQYHVASSFFGPLWARIGAIFTGRFVEASRFYHLAGDLVHKKRQVKTIGEEDGVCMQIIMMRNEMSQLSPMI